MGWYDAWNGLESLTRPPGTDDPESNAMAVVSRAMFSLQCTGLDRSSNPCRTPLEVSSLAEL